MVTVTLLPSVVTSDTAKVSEKPSIVTSLFPSPTLGLTPSGSVSVATKPELRSESAMDSKRSGVVPNWPSMASIWLLTLATPTTPVRFTSSPGRTSCTASCSVSPSASRSAGSPMVEGTTETMVWRTSSPRGSLPASSCWEVQSKTKRLVSFPFLATAKKLPLTSPVAANSTPFWTPSASVRPEIVAVMKFESSMLAARPAASPVPSTASFSSW